MDYFFKSKYFFDVSIALLKNKWLPFVLGIPLFFCLHHYEGIIIDARLYLLQVIHSWFPERFVGDPPFMFGNQDNYGIFTFFYSFILKIFPIDMGAFVFSLFAQSLWLVAAFYFVYHFTKKMQIRLWFLPLILCFLVYSGYKMPNDHSFFFRFAENICVSRSLSMSIGFLGLGMLFTKRKYASLILFFWGTVIHPLTAGWGIPVWMFLYYPKTRIPIFIIAAVLPMTFLLRYGRFDIYPTAWGNCTHNHPIHFLMIWRIAVAIIFFKLFIPKFDRNKFFLKIANSASDVLLLGFYWLITGGLAKHILIYQVQVWRVEWLFFILAMPTFLYIVYKQIWLFRHKRFTQLTTRHISLLLMGFVMFMPAPCSGALAVALILLLVPEKRWNLPLSMFILVSLCIISACEQELMKNFLWGVFEFRFFTSIDMYRAMCCGINNLLFLQLIWIIGIIVSCLYRIIKENKDKALLYCVIFFLLVYIFFPQFQLLPATLFGFILFYKRQINFILFFLILLLGIGDCFFDTELRESNILVGFPRRILGTLFYIVPIIIGILAYFLKPLRGGGSILIASSVLLAIFAFDGYDKRTASVKKFEASLDVFKEKTIFPQVKERGKMFYYVTGDYADESRTQFLTGSYYSETTPVGEALFQKQFEEERKRLNYIFFKEQRGFIAGKGDWREFVKDSLSNEQVLLDRMYFLCSINEITHLVSNLRLKGLEKQDSLTSTKFEMIYLYGCPKVQN